MIVLEPFTTQRLVEVTARHGIALLPLYRAGYDGTLTLGNVLRAHGNLDGYELPEPGKPAVIMLSPVASLPDTWLCLPALRVWAQLAMIVARVPTESDYEYIIELALQRDRLLLIHALPTTAATWAQALEPLPVEMLVQ